MLEDRLGSLTKIERDLEDATTLVELGEAEGDQAAEAEGITALRALKAEGERRQLEALLSGEADANDTYVEVHSGAGGTESCDWARMLLRMYMRWAERRKFDVELVEETDGDEAGVKSATIIVKGPTPMAGSRPSRACTAWCAFPRSIPTRAGTRASPPSGSIRSSTTGSRSRSTRATAGSTRIAPRARAASTSTRPNRPCASPTFPTGIVVACQSERSQHKNRATAWNMLRARLYELELQKREEKATADAASKTDIGWGHQIRSYVLQPYQMVKDLRTGHVSSSPDEVLDGDLDPFMEASLAQRLSGRTVAVEDVE